MNPFAGTPLGRDASRAASLSAAVARMLEARALCPPSRALLVGLSGIDGSGKGCYFPAQALHFERDEPRGSAHLIIDNTDLR